MTGFTGLSSFYSRLFSQLSQRPIRMPWLKSKRKIAIPESMGDPQGSLWI
jgi:hypothetical protein